MSYLKLPGKIPQEWAVLKGLKALLVADSDVENLLGGSGRIYDDGLPDEKTFDPKKPWGRIVLSTPTNPYPTETSVLGRRYFIIICRCQVGIVDVDNYDARRHLAEINQRAYDAMNTKRVDLDVGILVNPVLMVGDPEKPETFDEEGYVEQRSEYLAIVDPVAP